MTRHLLWAGLLAIVGCEGAPKLRPPPPESQASVAPAEALEASSTFVVPLRIDLSMILDAVEETLPRAWGDIDSLIVAEDGETEFAVELSRGALVGSFDRDLARIESVVEYRFRTRIDLPLLPDAPASCGSDDERPRMRVAATAPLRISPSWNLQMGDHLLEIEAFSEDDRDRCEVTILGLDVTERLVTEAESFAEDQRATIDELVQGVDIRSDFEGWWDSLQEPVQLGDRVWLTIGPRAISVERIRGAGESIDVQAVLEASPKIHLGAEAPQVERHPLPRLETVTGASNPGFRAVVETSAEYPALAETVSGAVRGRTLTAAGNSLRVERVALEGIGDGRVSVAVEVTGDVEGTLYLVGTPTFDATDQVVFLRDLGFEAATNDLLVRTAAWVLDVGAPGLIGQRTRWPLRELIEWSTEMAEDGLNSEIASGVRLSGGIDSVHVANLVALPDGLRISAFAFGVLQVTVASR